MITHRANVKEDSARIREIERDSLSVAEAGRQRATAAARTELLCCVAAPDGTSGSSLSGLFCEGR